MAEPNKARPGGKSLIAELMIQTKVKGLSVARKGLNDLAIAAKTLTTGVNDNVRLAEEANIKFSAWAGVAKDINGIGYRVDELRGYIDALLNKQMDLSQVPEEIQASLVKLGADYRKVLTQVSRDIDGANASLREHSASLDGLPDRASGLLQVENAISKNETAYKTLSKTVGALFKPFEDLISVVPEVKELFDIGNKSLDTFRETTKKLGLDIDQFLLNKLFGGELKIDPKFSDILGKLSKAGGSKSITPNLGSEFDKFSQPLDLVPDIKAAKSLDAVAKSGLKVSEASAAAATGVKTASAATTALGASAAPAGPALAGAAGGMQSLGGAAVLAHPIVLAVAATVAVMAGGILALTKGLMANNNTMMKFRTTGYRASGSIRALTDNVFDLSIQLGVNQEEAAASVDALARANVTVVGIGKSLKDATGRTLTNTEAMLSLTKTNAMFAKATGASATATAKFQKAMTVLNTDISKQEAMLGRLTEASKKYGLSGEQLDSVMSALAKESTTLKTIWGEDSYDKVAEQFIALSGAANTLGVDVGDLGSKILHSDESLTKLLALGGRGDVLFSGDPAAVMEAAAESAENYLKILNEMPEGRMRTNFLSSLGVSADELQVLAEANKLLHSNTTEQRNKIAADKAAAQALQESYGESLKTITESLQRIAAPIMALINKAVGPLADMMVEAFTVVQPLIDQLMPILQPAIDAFKEMGTAIGENFTVAFKLAAPLLVGLAKLGASVAAFVFKMVTAFVKFSTVLGTMLAPIIGAISTALGGIGMIIGGLLDGISKVFGFFTMLANEILKSEVAVLFLDSVKGMLQDLVDLGYAVKKALFGSSMFHIAEGIAEITPSLTALYDAFYAITHPIETARKWINSLWSDVDNAPKEIKIKQDLETVADGDAAIANREVVISDESLQSLVKTKNDIMAVASPIYTVLLTEERNQRGRQVNELIDGMDRVISLLAGIVNSEDPNTKKSADALDKLVGLAGKSSEHRTFYPDNMPDGMGERSSRWWPST